MRRAGSQPRRARSQTAVLVMLGCVGLGCSGESFSTGSGTLASSRTLDTLSDDEQQQLCGELRTQIDETTSSDNYRNVRCTVSAWAATADVALAMRVMQCQSRYDQCVTTSNEQLSDNVTCTEFAPLTAACTTVGEMRECYRAWGPAIEQVYIAALAGQPTNCVEAFQAGGVDATPMSVQAQAPEQCVEIYTACHP